MNDKQWEPLTTPEAVIEAIKAGRHVEFTPCGCDYQLPSCKDTFSGSGGWVIPEYEDEYDMLTAVKGPEAPDDSFRYRALIAPAQPHSCANCLGVDPASCMFAPAQPASGDAFAQSLAERHLPSDEAEQIAARVPLPQPIGNAWEGGRLMPAYTADQLRAAILAGVREAMRGGEPVGYVTADGGVTWLTEQFGTVSFKPKPGTDLYTTPPAPAVDEAMVKRAIRADAEIQRCTPNGEALSASRARAILTAALKEPEA